MNSLSAFQLLETNKNFLNRLFCRSIEKDYLLSLFPSNPQLVSVLVFYAPEETALHTSQTTLIQNCNSCILDCSLEGHAFLSGHDYFILVLKNESYDEQTVNLHFNLIMQQLREKYDIQILHHACALCRFDLMLGQNIQSLLNSVSAFRYYGREFSSQSLNSISNLRLQQILDYVEKQCELGNLTSAIDLLKLTVQQAHKDFYFPMNVKRSTLRIMYSFFSVNNRYGGEQPYYDIPHFIVEQILKADTCNKLEQTVEAFCTYTLYSAKSPSLNISEPIRHALDFIHDNYQRPIKLKEVADAIHLNKSYFSQLFQKTMGVTYSEYLENLRIRSAKHYLKSTDKTASEIAEVVGFSSQNYFTKVFKNSVGISPIRFRYSKIS